MKKPPIRLCRLIPQCVFALLAAMPAARAQRLPPIRIHDPSMPQKEGSVWWLFSTGRGVASRYSKDLKTWLPGPPVFDKPPGWHLGVAPAPSEQLWAPDLIRVNGRYRLYYSVSVFGKNTSAIGLASTPALDPRNSAHAWRDDGMVLRSTAADTYNAIDPQPVIDAGGRHWLVFGSYWRGIHLLELDPATGLAHPRDKEIRQLAWKEQIEAAAILRHGGYYYLFVNWGHCCRGLDSTYEIRVGRAREITGPYLDRDGRGMATGGGTLVLASDGDRIGPGHASFITCGHATRMFYHYYHARYRGMPTVGSGIVNWSGDGWPSIQAARD